MVYTQTDTATAGFATQGVLVSFPIACFTLTLLSDLAYWNTETLLWQHFSEWLLLAGLVGGGLALIGWLVRRARQHGKTRWSVALLDLLVLVAAFVNSLLHAGDGWTGIVPWGVIMSAVTVGLMLIAGLLGGTTIRAERRVA